MTAGPVSQTRETESLEELYRQGSVVWLDRDSGYMRFVDCLVERHRAGTFPYPVVAFRGSFPEGVSNAAIV